MQISWITKGLRTGVLTTRYPAVSEPMPSGFRGLLTLDGDRCQGAENCSACVNVCLPQALTLDCADDGRLLRLRLNLGACIACGQCVDACPANAIALGPEYELAAHRIEDLCTDLNLDSEVEHGCDEHRG